MLMVVLSSEHDVQKIPTLTTGSSSHTSMRHLQINWGLRKVSISQSYLVIKNSILPADDNTVA